MTAAYDLGRLRRLLLLLPAAARAASRGRGVPLAEAVELTGARSVRQLVDDLALLGALYIDPGQGKVTPGNYLLGFVLGFGGEATIEAPADVALQLGARIEELRRLYR